MSLQNFKRARKAMVVSQLQPSGIGNEKVDAAFMDTPREMFVPNALRGVCYLDDDINLGNGRILMEPLILGRMIQNASLGRKGKVLDVGGATGYSAAVLAHLAGEVVALDKDEKLLHTARLNWENLDLQNITAVIGNHQDGYANGAPYDAIFVNGAVGAFPEKLMEQLKKDGKLFCVLVEKGNSTGVIISYEKREGHSPLIHEIAGAMTSYLPGFEPAQQFEF